MSDDIDREADSEQDDEPVASERRGDARHLACFPAHVETEQGGQRSALIRDLSVSGALLLTRARLAVGDPVRLSLYLKEGTEPFLAAGRVVRRERLPIEQAHPWTKAVGVQFEPPLPELESDAVALAARQAALYAKK